MATYGELTTVHDLRETWQGSIDTAQDVLVLQLIRAVSVEINGTRQCYPKIETRYYDAPSGRTLYVDDTDWLEVTTVTNGDGTAILAANRDALPYYGPPFHSVRLGLTSGLIWLMSSTTGSPERAISVTGVTGFAADYAGAWVLSASTVGNTLLAAAGTSITGITAGTLYAGQLLKLGATNDYAYVSAMSSGGNVATVVRSVNGSTGVTHAVGEAIYVWSPGPDIETLCKMAVQARLRLKDNPTGETVRIGTDTFSTPKDITKWLGNQLYELGYTRPY
jgi:hypothetical protein